MCRGTHRAGGLVVAGGPVLAATCHVPGSLCLLLQPPTPTQHPHCGQTHPSLLLGIVTAKMQAPDSSSLCLHARI